MSPLSVIPEDPAALEPTVRDLLRTRAERHPQRTALIAASMVEGGEARLDYAALRGAARRMAAVLAEVGVGRGDRVGILLENDAAIEAHVTYHASHLLGAINVPLNTRYVARELAYVLEFVKPAAVVFAPAFAELLGQLRESLGSKAVLLEVSEQPRLGRSLPAALAAAEMQEVPAIELSGADDADWIFTSGTTGNPRAVALSHAGSVACGYQSTRLWGVDGTSVYQSFAPFFTSTGSHTNLLGCLAAGCAYVVEPQFEARQSLDRIVRYHTTTAFLISSVLALILERLTPEELDAYDMTRLQRVCYGAQSSSPAFCRRVWEEIGKRWEVELVNVYGITEGGTSGIILTNEDHPAALERMGAYGISIGRTDYHSWSKHAILDERGAPAAIGEVGELCLRGPSTMSRYVEDPEATSAALRDGWLHTGDMACADEDGFVYFVDRSKQLIRRGGLNISSAEVEGVLLEHPGVAEVAAVPLPNPVLGEDVRAVVVRASDVPAASADDLIAFCRQRLASYKVPVQVDFVDALPRNAMNRVMKSVLTGSGGALR